MPRSEWLLERCKDALPLIPWQADRDTQSPGGPFGGDRGLLQRSNGSWSRPCVYGPESPKAAALDLESQSKAAGLNAEAIVWRQGAMDPETLRSGPAIWRVRVLE